MSNDIPRRNVENYSDLTAHDALAAVTKEEAAKEERAASPRPGRKLVYICSPYRGETEHNARLASRYCRFAISRNVVPVAVHLLYTQFLDDTVRRERNIGLSCGITVLRRCDALWYFGEYASEGMRSEIEAAKRLGIPVHHFNSKCREVQPV